MIILPKQRAVFVSHQRCATHTMYSVLESFYDGFHYSGDGYHGRLIPVEYHGWYTFGICRNPYSLAVSIWRATTARTIAYTCSWKFAEIARDRRFPAFARVIADVDWTSAGCQEIDPTLMAMPQTVWFAPVAGRLGVVLQVENLDHDCKRLPFWVGPEHLPRAANILHHIGPPWREYYRDSGTVKAIQKWAGRDFETFGYDENSYKLP